MHSNEVGVTKFRRDVDMWEDTKIIDISDYPMEQKMEEERAVSDQKSCLDNTCEKEQQAPNVVLSGSSTPKLPNQLNDLESNVGSKERNSSMGCEMELKSDKESILHDFSFETILIKDYFVQKLKTIYRSVRCLSTPVASEKIIQSNQIFSRLNRR